MTELKTKVKDRSVTKFLQSVTEEQRQKDGFTLVAVMEQAVRAPARMWGTSIVGFGTYRYRFASGRQAEWFLTGFSPRKKDLTLYSMSGFDGYEELLSVLGEAQPGEGVPVCQGPGRPAPADAENAHSAIGEASDRDEPMKPRRIRPRHLSASALHDPATGPDDRGLPGRPAGGSGLPIHPRAAGGAEPFRRAEAA